jgi:predicted AAA+ superfamily ATPase
MRIPRYYADLERYQRERKVLVLYGPRQVGKTTLLEEYLHSTPLKWRLDSGDDIRTRQILGSQDLSLLREYVAGFDLIAIDEAQRIPQVGQGLKLIVDHLPNLRVITTGSSSFELAGQIGEPLTGRKVTLTLFPVSQLELLKLYNPFDLKGRLEESLIFGGYPEVVSSESREEKIRILDEIVGSYLLKDILELDRIRSPKTLLDLLRLLAFQIGGEVSLSELGSQLGIDYKTVSRYLSLLEKSFIVCSLRGYSRNLRKEITTKNKYFYYDPGVRNAVIANFNRLELRDDAGRLWENFVFVERLKKQAYHGIQANSYFWRTWGGSEIDMVEEREGTLFGYEFKWGAREPEPPKEWTDAYPAARFEVVNRENYLDFVT